MKTSPFLETVPRFIFDDKAYSHKEICEWSGKTRRAVDQMVKAKVSSGEWEAVWKHSDANGKPVRAWRLKRKKK
jgi:hypothetical protein